MSGRVVDIDVNPDRPTEFYVAYASGGLWYTRNNGQSFIPVSDNLPNTFAGDVAVNWKERIVWLWFENRMLLIIPGFIMLVPGELKRLYEKTDLLFWGKRFRRYAPFPGSSARKRPGHGSTLRSAPEFRRME